MKITDIFVTLNPDSAESFNDVFSEKLWQSYPDNLEIGTEDFSDDDNQAYLATFLYHYDVFRPKIP